MKLRFWASAGLLITIAIVFAVQAEYKSSWRDAIKRCGKEGKRLPSVEEAIKDINSTHVGKITSYKWTTEYITNIRLTHVDDKSSCGYYILSEAIEADKLNQKPPMRFGSCTEKRYYVKKKEQTISTEKITWAEFLKKGCLGCGLSSIGVPESKNYWSMDLRQIFRENSREPPQQKLCVALNGSRVVYPKCSDKIEFECKSSAEEDIHDDTNKRQPRRQDSSKGRRENGGENIHKQSTRELNHKPPHKQTSTHHNLSTARPTETTRIAKDNYKIRKDRKGGPLLLILCLCIGCLFTLVVVAVVVFICHHRRTRPKRTNHENDQQQEDEPDNDAEYDYIAEGEVCTVTDYYKNPVDAIELVKVVTDKYVEPYDSKINVIDNRPTEKVFGDSMTVSTASLQNQGISPSEVHAYNKVIIRPDGVDTTYDATNVCSSKQRVGITDNAYDTVETKGVDKTSVQAPNKKDGEKDTVSIAKNEINAKSFIDSNEKELQISMNYEPISSEPGGPLYYKLEAIRESI